MTQIQTLKGELIDSSAIGITEKASYDFPCDKRLAEKPFVIDLKLCRVYLNNNKNFPWLILVPRLPVMAQNILGLSDAEYVEFCREKRIVMQALVNEFGDSEQMNSAEFSVIVRQFHSHLIARNTNDIDWPKSVFDSPNPAIKYTDDEKKIICDRMKKAIERIIKK
jgi:diadenosine tetraphosphate (Ap4A) HIT family hydrolase